MSMIENLLRAIHAAARARNVADPAALRAVRIPNTLPGRRPTGGH